MRIGKHGKHEREDDMRLIKSLDGEEKEFVKEFVREASTHSPDTSWGKKRRALAAKDIFHKRLKESDPARKLIFSPGFVDYVIDVIDTERGASEDNDIEPGIIKTPHGYKCSVGTPFGYEKRNFQTLCAARSWVKSIRSKHKDHCYG